MSSSTRPRIEPQEDPLAYGDDYQDAGRREDYGGDQDRPQQEDEGGEEGERGIIGDTYRKLRGKPPKPAGESSGLGSFIFDKFHGAVQDIGSELGKRFEGKHTHHTHDSASTYGSDRPSTTTKHRFGSFAGPRPGNEVKWFVDGCGYFWAVSLALEQATQSIWILDWWLSPELYLRRPPSRNEQYRIDRMLLAAAQRGVRVNIIVYKEVTQALTRKYLTPVVPQYLQSLLRRGTNPISRGVLGLGVAATFASLEHLERESPLILPPLSVSSSHTKHALEKLHPNIAVFRHPDHLPDAQTLSSSFISSLQNISLSAKTASNLPLDALKGIYGMNEDVILYWAHHEKLLLIDGKVAFMGGLDLCYGRWDTNQHPIADCHPSNLDDIVFPGQDYNNARIMDFQDVAHWEQNKLDRRVSSRMGWSDISVNIRGPVVEDLCVHFVQRWNFIYDEKYDVRKDTRYSRLAVNPNIAAHHGGAPPLPQRFIQHQFHDPSIPLSSSIASSQTPGNFPPPPAGSPPSSNQGPSIGAHGQPYNTSTGVGQEPAQDQYYPPPPEVPSAANTPNQPYYPPPPTDAYRGIDYGTGETESRGFDRDIRPDHRHHYEQRAQDEAQKLEERLRGRYEEGKQYVQNQHLNSTHVPDFMKNQFEEGGIPCQIARSCSKWSHGVPTEHSIQSAYISVIENSRHFIYIENQFFITATSEAQKPVKNMIGAAIVDRILKAARAGEKFKIIVVMPAIPAFAGDLKNDASLGTRAIMEFQYNSINRGRHSIMEVIADAGYDPTEYIRFYNLRNYDRIDVGGPMTEAEKRSGVDYDLAREEHDEAVELPADLPVEMPGDIPNPTFTQKKNYEAYQKATSQMKNRDGLYTGLWDSVSGSYMLGGQDIRSVPWQNGDLPEIDAFVSEELYVHSKVLIADDQVVICGSANLNDRSQLGYHDSEIAVIVEDPTPIESYMNGKPYRASKFAATLRRQLFRKHLGLLPAQDMSHPDHNFEPLNAPNKYDYGSPEDNAVRDPLADTFLALWNTRARTNTQVFSRVFHPVPDDSVRTWQDYDKFYEHFFHDAGQQAEGKDENKAPSKYMWGHVVAEEFSPGDQGCREVKDLLSQIKGTLVEMPLLFLIKEDIAKEGLSLNAFTKEVYT